MLQLVFGRSGYGKTEYIRNRIADKIDRGETQVLLITPEQYSFISEYSLLEQLGEARAHAVRCLSFSRLCDECDRLYGADGRKPLTKGGKALYLHCLPADITKCARIWSCLRRKAVLRPLCSP